MITENLSTLKIHKLTQEQYERELAAGRIDENAIYLTPDEEIDLSKYVTQEYIDEALAGKQPIGDYALKSEIPESTPAIIDVVELPTENIREDVFYRVVSGTFVYNQFTENTFSCTTVDGLPETGNPVTTTMEDVIAYYNSQDRNVYGYINNTLSAATGVPAGWYTLDTLAPSFDVTYSGIITNILEDPCDNAFRLLLEYVLYDYKNGNWTSNKKIGWTGTGASAEIFNHPSNIASGNASHAEGQGTHAEGYGSHAEGDCSHASGSASHAEGYASHAKGDYSHAEGDYSHAEGYGSHAEGDCSHAEGYYSHAEGSYSHTEGYYSHAEGHYSHASGRSQHVQGEYNITDPEYNTSNARAKYAHIVGNGISDTARSNAHTLDWNGNAWFQGDVYVGGKSQDDADAKRLLTEYDVVGRITTGTVYPDVKDSISGEIGVTAGKGAEIFNNYENNIASGGYSHAEGSDTTASGYTSHAEGFRTTASHFYSHAEGCETTASGAESHAEGWETTASGEVSHAEGSHTTASGHYQHVQGKYNIDDPDSKYAHIVGNGNSDTPSNAHTLDWDGLGWYAGGLKVGGTGQDDPNAKEVALKEDIAQIAPVQSVNGKTGSVQLNAVDVKARPDTWMPTAQDVGALSKDTPLFSGDYKDLENAPNISEDDSGNLIIADKNGNIIFRSNGDGFETVNLTVQNITINGKTIQEMIQDYVNEAILGGAW